MILLEDVLLRPLSIGQGSFEDTLPARKATCPRLQDMTLQKTGKKSHKQPHDCFQLSSIIPNVVENEE